MIIHLVRIVFILVVLFVTISFAFQPDVLRKGGSYATAYILVPAIVAFGLVMVDMLWKQKRLATLSGLFFGMLAGLVIAFILSLIVDSVVKIYPGPDPVENPGQFQMVRNAAGKVNTSAAARQYETKKAAWERYTAHDRMVRLIKLLLGAAAFLDEFSLEKSLILRRNNHFQILIAFDKA